MASPKEPRSDVHGETGSLSPFRILEDVDGNEKVENFPLGTSSGSTTPSFKNPTKPNRLFEAGAPPPLSPISVDGDQKPLENFVASKEFSQLLTLPIKYREHSKCFSPGKENEVLSKRSSSSRQLFLADDQEFKECGHNFKRPNPPDECSTPVLSKKAKSNLHSPWTSSQSPSTLFASLEVEEKSFGAQNNGSHSFPTKSVHPQRLSLTRSQSESAVKHAVEQNSSDPLLIGDGTKHYILPVVSNGNHDDLKEINSATLVDVIEGKYASQIKSSVIIDCRYPYEFQGGHIKGALNFYTQQQIHSAFLENQSKKNEGDFELERNIIIFHCEFSSRRAPSLCRFLRSADRLFNDEAYPALHYPELYVLFGGYKNFFQNYGSYCEPMFYLTMLDENHKEDFRRYKNKSNSELVTNKPNFGAKSFSRWTTGIKQPKF